MLILLSFDLTECGNQPQFHFTSALERAAACRKKKKISRTILMCLSIGTPKNKKIPFVPNGKLMTFRCPKIWAHYNLVIKCLNIGTPKNH